MTDNVSDPKVRKNGLFVLIDALRYETLADPDGVRELLPNLSRLVDKGWVRRVVTNAPATQFVMPALFSQSYPLDHGGYNTGIRNRPKSFVEALRESGYRTHMVGSCNQIGPSQGYDRGFDDFRTTIDFRTTLQIRIERFLRFYLERMKRGEMERSETISLIQRELDIELASIEKHYQDYDTSLWPPRLAAINQRIARGCAAERAVLRDEPETVLHKLDRIPPGVYWHYLGAHHVFLPQLLVHRLFAGLSWRWRKYIARQSWFPFLTLDHYLALAGEIVPEVVKVLTSGDGPRFVYTHMMDVHDCRAVNRPWNMLGRLRYLPRWWRARRHGVTRRRFIYDSALMYVDEVLGTLLDALERSGEFDNTVILVTGDHGSWYAESPRPKMPVAGRMFYEDIEVPLLLVNAGPSASDDETGLIDSMGVSATMLDALNVVPHNSFRGISALRGRREAVISECAYGIGADLASSDLSFTVTTPKHRLMAVLSGNSLAVSNLYDRGTDPRELVDIKDDPASGPVIDRLLGHIYQQRDEILALRGIRKTD